MSGPKDALLKRWHAWFMSAGKARRTWQGEYWIQRDRFRDIDCRFCRLLDEGRGVCRIRFGTPLRKCSTAAIEAHLNDCRGEEVLEIGFGRLATARKLIERSGGRWTGIDPGQPLHRKARLGRGGYGHARLIPFPHQTFDRVVGIQTFEHWGQKTNSRQTPSDYGDCLREVRRVMKPGGRLYLDAPMHFHGHEMFIMGDVTEILARFDPVLWDDVVVERWRRQHAPLEPYPPSAKIQAEWPLEITHYAESEVIALKQSASVWLLTISARRR